MNNDTMAALEELADRIVDTYRRINTRFLITVGERIKEIGLARPKELHQIEQILACERDADRIIREIANAAGASKERIKKLLNRSAKDDLDFAKVYYKFRDMPIPNLTDNEKLMTVVNAVARQVGDQIDNLSLTTAVKLRTAFGTDSSYTLAGGYRKIVSEAILAAQNGIVDYNTAIRSTLRSLADGGIKVIEYESGYMRRIGSAVRMNVLDGVRQLNQQMRDMIGEDIGADGVEISAHFTCAEDHLPYQGKQYSLADFEDLQNSLRRPFGQWNCRHKRFAIILGISKPVYSADDLESMRKFNRKKITIDGEPMNIMQARQILNALATQREQQQDRLSLFNSSGDSLAESEAQDKITAIDSRYKKIQDIIDGATPLS